MQGYVNKLQEIADYHLPLFERKGHAVEGCNGPYGNEDTPIRNTAHWCCTYRFFFKKTNEKKYFDILQQFSAYLLMNSLYGSSGVAICRTGYKDDTNGVIGQAWVIEGLLACYDILGDKKLLERAVSVFKSQPFDYEKGLWKICCSNGETIGYDYVYNHNLWMAASGALILEKMEEDSIRNTVICFLDHSHTTYGVQPSGRLYHLNNFSSGIVGNLKFFVKKCLTDVDFGSYGERNYLEKGYQLFDLYGFAILKERFPDHPELGSQKLLKAVKYGCSDKVLAELGEAGAQMNKYGYPYNSPAFEYPYVAKVFEGSYDEKIARKLLDIQFKNFFDEETMTFSRNTADPETLTARIYELTRCF